VYANFGENRECLCFEPPEIGEARLKGDHEIGSAVAYKLGVVLGASLRN
jgi:hypothetical protein